MEVVRVGFIGAGSMANAVHYPSVAECPFTVIESICDLRADRLHATADRYAVPKEKRYTDYRKMLEREELDAVYVIMPPMGLAPIVIDCLQAGKNVFIEKPPGCNADDAWAMAEEADRWKLKTMVGFNRRFSAVYRYAKRKIAESGGISSAVAEFHKDMLGSGPYYGMSILTTDIIHAVDVLRDLLGEPVTVEARVLSHWEKWMHSHNLFYALITFQGGRCGVLLANRTAGSRYERFEVHGRGISAYIRAPEMAEIFRQGAEGQVVKGSELTGTDDTRITYGYRDENFHFLECIVRDQMPMTHFADAARTMELVERIESFGTVL
ncbi:MAG: Gfo/Idh/MocA family oxidoreductase [Armatimonadetes bacterium]|nr:Gfo/Idh/MocA family oxidoreductase [Armatimonadota bacterium]MDW8121468.1 Gfo/Idh/MocA family oxidoreductase [Armatimonadota bacterium]